MEELEALSEHIRKAPFQIEGQLFHKHSHIDVIRGEQSVLPGFFFLIPAHE